MLKRNVLSSAHAVVALLVAVSALAAAGVWAKGQSGESSPGVRRGHRAETFQYSTHTLSAGQTVRLSAVNPPEPVADRGIVPCIRVTLAYDVYAQDAPGTVNPTDGETNPPDPVRLRFLRRVERVMELEPGEGATFEYAGSAGETVSPLTFVSDDEINPPDPVRAAVVTSLEVRQNGATQFVLPGTARGFNPQPDPPRVK